VGIGLGIGPQSTWAGKVVFIADLDGPSESSAHASPVTGFVQVDFDTILHTMRVQTSFSGLLGTTTASHKHPFTSFFV